MASSLRPESIVQYFKGTRMDEAARSANAYLNRARQLRAEAEGIKHSDRARNFDLMRIDRRTHYK